MVMQWHDVVGIAGVLLILLAYGALQTERLRSDQLAHSVINCLGASLVLVSLTQDFNLASFVIESVWVAISLYGIARWIHRRRAGSAPARTED